MSARSTALLVCALACLVFGHVASCSGSDGFKVASEDDAAGDTGQLVEAGPDVAGDTGQLVEAGPDVAGDTGQLVEAGPDVAGDTGQLDTRADTGPRCDPAATACCTPPGLKPPKCCAVSDATVRAKCAALLGVSWAPMVYVCAAGDTFDTFGCVVQSSTVAAVQWCCP